jgi:predicted phage terminase large subunit-like protein
MPPEASIYSALASALSSSWRLAARPEQLAPAGEWRTWLVLAGRGFGKTRTGAEWCHEAIAAGCGRIALVGPTAADARDVMVEGESGILATSPSWARPLYEPSKRRLTWASGAQATCFSAEEPERLRGPQHDAAWCDEVGTWVYGDDTWSMLQMGLRLGRNPRCVVTTTPRPTKLIRDLLSREGKGIVVTRGRTRDNAANLAPGFLDEVTRRYGGTRLGRQELDGELLDDVPGALWQRSWIDRGRIDHAPDLDRIVVAIDPAVTNTEGSDESGIVVAGVSGSSRDGQFYVLDDLTARMGPLDWAQRAISAFRRHSADRIIAEVNNGGELVEATIRMVDPKVPYKAVRASRGKAMRAEPISALYEQGRVHHVGSYPALEDQMCCFTSDFDRATAGYSPDRVDALVWALTELSEGGGTFTLDNIGEGFGQFMPPWARGIY